jgi:ABC-type nitrate/sulfonate/bicarbonate transport system substrate-binding protein
MVRALQTFTTKPYADQGEVDIIGGIPTPWPCFTMATTRQYAEANRERLVDVIRAVRKGCEIFKANRNGESIARVCAEHHLTKEDAEKWCVSCPVLGSYALSA